MTFHLQTDSAERSPEDRLFLLTFCLVPCASETVNYSCVKHKAQGPNPLQLLSATRTILFLSFQNILTRVSNSHSARHTTSPSRHCNPSYSHMHTAMSNSCSPSGPQESPSTNIMSEGPYIYYLDP